ncbi:hypothetical protein BDQ17DRAFT_1222078, partial [Cyathus striatus]
PPTPPPTTAVELQDEARSTVSASASAQPTSSDLVQDPIQQKFPVISDFAMNGNFQQLTQLAEEVDLNASGERQVKRLLITAPLVLGYLILDEIPLARYALERLPEHLASHPLSQGLYELVMCVKHRQHTKMYLRTQSMINSTARDDFFDKNLAMIVVNMIANFIDRFRQKTFMLLSKAYISLPTPLASIYLGMPVDKVIAAAHANQWSYDSSANALTSITTEKRPNNPIISTDSFPVSTVSTFHFIVDSVGKLEL